MSSELSAMDGIEQEVVRLAGECGRTFKSWFGIRLDIEEIERWREKDGPKTLKESLDRMRAEISPGGCDIVLGVAFPNPARHKACGITDYFHGYILLRYLNSPQAMKRVLLHELCHIFGAVDIDEPGSIMDKTKPGLQIDEFTSRVVNSNRLRSFRGEGFPLTRDRTEEVFSAFKRRAQLGRREPIVNLTLALLHLEQEDFTPALEQCARILEEFPEIKEIYNVIGNVYFRQGHFDEAISGYRNALQFSPDSPELHFNLALACSKKGAIVEAESEYRKAIELNPNYPKAYAYLAHLYLRQRMVDKAIQECHKALSLRPEYSEALYLNAAALIQKGDLSKKVGVGPEKPAGEEVVVYAAEENVGRFDEDRWLEEAKVLCEKAISIEPRRAEPHNILGICFVYQGQFREGEEEFLTALKLRPAFIHAHYNLGLLYLKNNLPGKAAFHLKKIIEMAPLSDLGVRILAKVFGDQSPYSIPLEIQNASGPIIRENNPK